MNWCYEWNCNEGENKWSTVRGHQTEGPESSSHFYGFELWVLSAGGKKCGCVRYEMPKGSNRVDLNKGNISPFLLYSEVIRSGGDDG